METMNVEQPAAQELAKPLPDRLVKFIRRVIRGEKFYSGPERRISLRYPITMPVRVTPLDDHQQPTNEPFLAVTRDISVTGLCFYHTHPVKQTYLQMELTGPSLEQCTVLLKAARCRPAGPFYEIGGRFLGEA
ncbi:MAG: PilZ domain-containing protein [Pirellulales bacterium]|nr:PilZ domain-containing protein [Pirellulales bacterium]